MRNKTRELMICKWNLQSYFTKTYILTPFCECEKNIHPCKDGQVVFTKDKEWWTKTAPWIARGTKVLSIGLQLAFVGMPITMGADVFDAIKDDVNFMNELAKNIPLEEKSSGEDHIKDAANVLQGDLAGDMREDDGEMRLIRAALANFLETVAPDNFRARQWGSLQRIKMSDNSYRWLCGACAKQKVG